MRKTEEALCNGIIFSIPRLVPSSIQEGEIEDAKYYAYVLLTPKLDKLVIKIWEAPDYKSFYVKGKEIESIEVYLEAIDNENDSNMSGYNYEHKGAYYVTESFYGEDIIVNSGDAYDGLMLYPAIKCILVEVIKSINRIKEQDNG